MSSRRSFRILFSSIVVLVMFVLALLGGASVALAGAVNYWTVQPSGDVPAQPVVAYGDAVFDGRPLVSSSLKLFMDGIQVARPTYTATVLSGYVYVYYAPPLLADGSHTFRVEVSDSTGKLSYREWDATIKQPPSATWRSPIANTTIYTGRPSIAMSVSDNTPGTKFTVSGQVRTGGPSGPIATTFGGTDLNAGTNSFAPSSELVFGTYYLTATVTDSAGNSRVVSGSAARKFTTASAQAMTVLESCDTCHASIRNAHPTPPSADCMLCHPEKGDDHMQGTDYCEDCHWDGWHKPNGTSVAVTYRCVECHTSARPAVPRHTASNTAAAHEGSCGGCHLGTLLERHATTTAGSSYSYQCDTCHASSNTAVQVAIATGNTSCSACHIDNFHDEFPQKHTAPTATCVGSACHATTQLVDMHNPYVGPGHRYPQYADACALCHQNEDPDRVPDDASSECASCHPERVVYHGYLAERHTASPAPETFTIGGVNLGSHECAECHGLELAPLHTSETCSDCHAALVDQLVPAWSKGCVQGGCHSVGSSRPQHAEIESAHVGAPSTCTSTAGCHSGGTNLAAIHQQQGCAGCHGAGVTPTAACVTCHDLETPHGDDRAIHASNVASGDVVLFTNHDGLGTITWNVECAWCHGETNLLDLHNNACSTCHSSPRSSFTTWNKTCQQGGCHVSFHDDGPPAHQTEYEGGNCEYYCHNNDWEVPIENCGACHTFVDTAPPVTSSNAQAAYIGPARLTLSTYDPFPASGVAHTYYTIDGGAQAEGTTVDVAPPASGTQSRTVRFWSVDNQGHVESVKTATFNVTADTTPPSTTSNAKASYVGPATIRLTATDNGTRGVKATYYRIDGGPATSGTVASVPQPSSGVASHTLEFWSVDWSDIEEQHHTVSFTNSVDSMPPTTTVSGLSTWLRFYRAWITLDAVDAGDAGVAASYGIIDGSNWIGGPSTGHLVTNSSGIYLVEGYHTLEYWSVDSVGNTESHRTTNFGVDWHGPAISHNGQASYNGPATIRLTSTDPWSGVNQIWYRLDSGTTQYSDTVNVPAPASGYVNHTLQYWSSDNAGNQTSGSFTFRVNAGADTAPPTGTMSVNSGASWATSTAVTVNSSVTDAGSGVNQMSIDPGTGAYGPWIAYSASSAITLPATDGTKTVRVRYIDNASNTLTLTDTIGLDTVGPTGTMSINNDAASTQSLAATVNSTVLDATSGTSQMRIDPGTGTYGGWITYSATSAITLPGGDGVKTVNVQYRDSAGLITTLTDTITYTTPPDVTAPTTTSNAQSSYTGSATITLSAVDNLGGSGVAHTYYSVDGGAQSEGTSILVAGPASGSQAYSVEFWSVDVAGNAESPHKTANFTISAPGEPQTGTIIFRWAFPAEDSWADFYIDGGYVGSVSMPNWVDDYSVTVPVRAQPYALSSEWYDSNYSSDPDWSYGSATIDQPGEVYIFNY